MSWYWVIAVLFFGFGGYVRITRHWPWGPRASGTLSDAVAVLRTLALLTMVGSLGDWVWQQTCCRSESVVITLLATAPLVALVELAMTWAGELYRRWHPEPEQIDQRGITRM